VLRVHGNRIRLHSGVPFRGDSVVFDIGTRTVSGYPDYSVEWVEVPGRPDPFQLYSAPMRETVFAALAPTH